MFKSWILFLSFVSTLGCHADSADPVENRQLAQLEMACRTGWSGTQSEIEEMNFETQLEYSKLCKCAQKRGYRCDSVELEEGWKWQFTHQILTQLPEFTKAEKLKQCIHYFLLNRLQLLAFFTRDACETADVPFAYDWIKPVFVSHRESIIGINEKACFIVQTAQTPLRIKTVCDADFIRGYRLKDPSLRNRVIQNPALNFILNGRISEDPPFAMANCHGTASDYARNFLGDAPVLAPKSWSSASIPKCMELANQKYNSISKPTVESVHPSQGISINMKHESCTEDDCGQANWIVIGCPDNKLDTYIFWDGMCIECWKKKLRQVGYQELNGTSGPTSLRKGCLLTQADHSITILNQSQGICDYFEATSPAGPPLIRVSPCMELWARFGTRFCPGS